MHKSLALCSALLCTNAFAEWGPAVPTSIEIYKNGYYLVSMPTGTTRTLVAGCTTSTTPMTLKLDGTDAPKALLSMLMTAWAAGKPITLKGTGTCDSVLTTTELLNNLKAD